MHLGNVLPHRLPLEEYRWLNSIWNIPLLQKNLDFIFKDLVEILYQLRFPRNILENKFEPYTNQGGGKFCKGFILFNKIRVGQNELEYFIRYGDGVMDSIQLLHQAFSNKWLQFFVCGF